MIPDASDMAATSDGQQPDAANWRYHLAQTKNADRNPRIGVSSFCL
ncbi:MAG: hypothetical protein NXI04_08780 [Planctomycetaceae bacterium]|nr:hypothetical protein [Planctomycetaceae bacterium]